MTEVTIVVRFYRDAPEDDELRLLLEDRYDDCEVVEMEQEES